MSNVILDVNALGCTISGFQCNNFQKNVALSVMVQAEY